MKYNKFCGLALALGAVFSAHADVVSYIPGTIATFGGTGRFNSTIYLTTTISYDLVANSMGIYATKPCQPDLVQIFTKTGIRIADIALVPNDGWGGITVMLPAGAYQIHITGAGVFSQLTISTKASK